MLKDGGAREVSITLFDVDPGGLHFDSSIAPYSYHINSHLWIASHHNFVHTPPCHESESRKRRAGTGGSCGAD
ncbi:hypothetical protein N7481_012825 [Penicillium waksmanii]|uniref:uncharacterized protein n=1 Tax=Penicillium waksmanii TaxID=69791 RepID=UPI002549B8AC|nr:uncharacterized protein N7481_012825 [Penicillium waksmanii]KAJ5966111.1 hypothetical protein N7481_012825 [Penicillium waksmanii]